MDAVQVVAGVVGSLAALTALLFAWQTVRETRQMRREDRLARLPDLVAELGAVTLRILNGNATEKRTTLPVARMRLEAGIASVSESLPCCAQLAGAELSGRSEADVEREVEGALAEITARLNGLRGD